jgi:hypothetical protein
MVYAGRWIAHARAARTRANSPAVFSNARHNLDMDKLGQRLIAVEIHIVYEQGDQAVVKLVVAWTAEQFAIMRTMEAWLLGLDDRYQRPVNLI